MSITTKIWLVSHLEKVAMFAVPVMCILVWLLLRPAGQMGLFMAVGTFGLVALTSTLNGILGTIIDVAITLLGYVAVSGLIFPRGICPIFILLLAIAFVYSITLGVKSWKFTRKNFQEVISKRTSYITSNVDRKEMEYEFALTRFNASFSAVSWLLAYVIAAIAFSNVV